MNILLIGGSRLQSYLVEEIKLAGDKSVVIDKNPECYLADKADIFQICDTHNHRKALEVGRKHEVGAVITAGTDVGYTVSYVAMHMGLHAVHPGIAWNTSKKDRMRDLINLPHPVWQLTEGRVYDWEGLCHVRKIPPYPCVLKPSDMSASRGVGIAYNAHEFRQAYWRALQESESGYVLAEEALGYVDGKYSPGGHREVAIDLAVIDGKPVVVNSAERMFSAEYPGIEIGHINPGFHDGIPPQVEGLAGAAAHMLGVDQGPFKMDLIFDERYGWCLLECATRWSGAFDHAVTGRYARQFNYTKALLEYAKTGRFPDKIRDIHAKPPIRFVGCITPLFAAGQVMTQDIVESYKTGLCFMDIVKTREKMEALTSCAVRPLFVFFSGGTKDEAWYNCVYADNHRKRIERSENPTRIGG